MIIHDPDIDVPVAFSWHYGQCYKHPSGLAYIHIPKNASSFTRETLIKSEFTLDNYKNTHCDLVMAVLRDPYERWITGAVEFITRTYSNKKVSEIVNMINAGELIFDQFEFDEHTARQTKFLHGLDTGNITFFRCDQNYTNNLNEFLKTKHNIVIDFKKSWRNRSKDSADKELVKSVVIKKINHTALNEYLKLDYDLINSATFYQV